MNAAVFEKRLELCERVCNYLEVRRGGRIAEQLKQNLHYEFMKFAVYLADSDGLIETEEIVAIRQLLKVNTVVPDLRTLKAREHIPHGYLMSVPLCMKAAVTDDVSADGKVGPFKGQCAQIIYDTYRIFGMHFIALHENDPSNKTAKAFTDYINNMQEYLKLNKVLIASDKKLYPVEELDPPKDSERESSSASEKEGNKDGSSKDENGTVFGAPVTENPVAGTEFDGMNLEEKLAEFHDMIGLTEVKHEVDSLINLIRIQKIRASYGLKNTETSKHMVFTGNPGTGKTTVARILAAIYKDLGVLEKGTFIEVDRSGLVKGYVGQTAIQVKKVVEEARGGMLFIDEAYTLTVNRGDNDYGQEAVDTLLKAMEDMRDELIVIVAGYPDLMEQFLESNPGLKSRFNKFIDFADYTVEEQLQIMEKMCEKQEYSMSENVKAYVREIIEARLANPDISRANGRDVRNMLENAIMRQATRLIEVKELNKETLTALEIEDFAQSLE